MIACPWRSRNQESSDLIRWLWEFFLFFLVTDIYLIFSLFLSSFNIICRCWWSVCCCTEYSVSLFSITHYKSWILCDSNSVSCQCWIRLSSLQSHSLSVIVSQSHSLSVIISQSLLSFLSETLSHFHHNSLWQLMSTECLCCTFLSIIYRYLLILFIFSWNNL